MAMYVIAGNFSSNTLIFILLRLIPRMMKIFQLFPTFPSISPALSVTALVNSLGISNRTISNFHYVDLFSRFLQPTSGVFSIRYLESFHYLKEYIQKLLSDVVCMRC